jgi:glycosyltransferase involved in cell wall biosynthesis
MHTDPRVSVIIPTYNRARWLPKAINSVLNQSYKNVEIIVINDGSTDDTKVVLAPYMNNIRYLTTNHKGAAHARNTGMQAATGKYIAFLDSDDTYLPYKLALQVSFIEVHPEVGMVCTEFSGDYNNGYVEEYHMRNYHPIWIRKNWCYEDVFSEKGEFSIGCIDNPIPYYIGDIFQYVLMSTLIPSNTVIFPRAIIESVGFQDETIRSGQDYEFVVRICKQYLVAFLNIPTYILVHHGKQLTNPYQHDILYEIDEGELFLKVVTDWAYTDMAYYEKNRGSVDRRLSEIYLYLGVKWMEYGDIEKANEFINMCRKMKPDLKEYRKFLWMSKLPLAIRRTIMIIYNKYTKWTLILKGRPSLQRLILKMGLKQRRFFNARLRGNRHHS